MNFLNELNAEKQKSEDTRAESAIFGPKTNPLLKDEDRLDNGSIGGGGGGIAWLSGNDKKEEEPTSVMWPSAKDKDNTGQEKEE